MAKGNKAIKYMQRNLYGYQSSDNEILLIVHTVYRIYTVGHKTHQNTSVHNFSKC